MQFRKLTTEDAALLHVRPVTEAVGFLPADFEDSFDRFFADLTQHNTEYVEPAFGRLLFYVHLTLTSIPCFWGCLLARQPLCSFVFNLLLPKPDSPSVLSAEALVRPLHVFHPEKHWILLGYS